jgi:hypothetical protein
METGGGFVPMEYFLTQAPQFSLFGDGTVIYQRADTRLNDPLGGDGLLPFLVGHLDEAGVQTLLRFALAEGRLLGARASYTDAHISDAPTTIFTLNAAGLTKTIRVYALGMDDGTGSDDALDRQGFVKLAQQLATFEQRGVDGQLGEIQSYDPSFYRVFLIASDGVDVQSIDWPWPDLTPAAFAGLDTDTRPRANLDRVHVSKVQSVPTGGRTGLYVRAEDGSQYSIGIRPLFPDELAAAGLGQASPAH